MFNPKKERKKENGDSERSNGNRNYEARKIDFPLKSITLDLGNVHIYENDIERTRRLLDGDEDVGVDLNV